MSSAPVTAGAPLALHAQQIRGAEDIADAAGRLEYVRLSSGKIELGRVKVLPEARVVRLPITVHCHLTRRVYRRHDAGLQAVSCGHEWTQVQLAGAPQVVV